MLHKYKLLNIFMLFFLTFQIQYRWLYSKAKKSRVQILLLKRNLGLFYDILRRNQTRRMDGARAAFVCVGCLNSS